LDPQPSYVVTPLTGFSPNIGRLVSMMSYTRWTTVRAVAGLSVSQLDHLHDAASNSIAALLAHIAAVEIAYQRITFGTGFAGKPASNYFKWFHVFEDELNHRGQIRWLRRRLPGASD
jgi:uncharacterized damage-inducible protein DinB